MQPNSIEVLLEMIEMTQRVHLRSGIHIIARAVRCARDLRCAALKAFHRAQSMQRARDRCDKSAPHHSESDPTQPKSAECSLSMVEVRTAPQHKHFNAHQKSAKRAHPRLAEIARHHSKSAPSKCTCVNLETTLARVGSHETMTGTMRNFNLPMPYSFHQQTN